MKKAVYQHLWKTYGTLPWLWVGIVAEIIRTLVQRIVIVIVIAAVASNITTGDLTAAKKNILLFVVIYIAAAIIGVVGDLLAIKTTDKRYQTLLLDYHKKLINKDMAFYRDNQTGYLASLFRQHLDGTIAIIRLLRRDIIRMFISLVFPVIVLFTAGWQLGLVAAGFVIIQALYIIWASDKANKYRKPAQEVYKKLTGEVADEVTNSLAFKSSGGETLAEGKVAELAKQEARLFWLRHKMTALFDLPRTLFTGLGISLSFLIALNGNFSPAESTGLIVLTFTYLIQIMGNVADLPDLIARYDEHFARVYPTLDYLSSSHETVLDPINPKELIITTGSIEITNVNFSYKNTSNKNNNKKVFDGLTIKINGGEHVGVVGHSGAGKSTLASLLMRFDDVDAGSISIDGIDIRHVRQSDLRQHIAYVPQEPLLFNRSIKENISYFKSNATDEEIIAAAKVAHADDFISELPDQYNSMVGERGVKLSGGQKQRIVIARAILKNAPILIFDEATSALDSESEQLIQNSLPTIISKHTAIVIAHRLSTVAKLDKIIVMDNGQIIEYGTHGELLEKRGKYFNLWQKQIAAV